MIAGHRWPSQVRPLGPRPPEQPVHQSL
jgi:hypothetical protein